jgi:uncharacterized protein (DUF1800 family)
MATPIPGRPEWTSEVVRLVRRVTLGATRQEVARAHALGYDAYLEYQLAYDRIDDSEADAFVAERFPALARPTEEIHAIPQDDLIRTLQHATLYRMAFSRRQLFERMVELWSDHFNIAVDKVGPNKIADDREVIRRHALGRFGDLLRASTHSVAMLGSLDQFVSRAGSPNQNYARELMELHTVGVDGGYTERDVADFSRVLTGWTFERQWGGQFVFDAAIHDWDAKTVLGVAIPAGSPATGAAGVTEGERIVDMLVSHPATARFIATKVLKWLLTPAPSGAQVDAVAGVFHETRGDLKAVVRAALRRDWLASAPPKFKRPAHYVASALRVLEPPAPDVAAAADCVARMGQPLFKWPTPDGYPDTMEYWSGSMLPRWHSAVILAGQQPAAGPRAPLAPYLAGRAEAAVDLAAERLFGGEMPALTRSALLANLDGGPLTETRVQDMLALALSSPAFQWY